MKKIKILIISLSLVLLCSFTFLIVNALATNKVEGSKGLTYHLSDDGTYYIVSDYNFGLSEADLVIPEEHKGLPVKEIANDAFADRTWLKSVYIPKTITKIGHGAFGRSGITKVYYNAENCQDFDSRNWVFYPDDKGDMNIDLVIGKDVKKIPNRLFFPLDTIPTLNPIINSITFEEGSQLEEIGIYAFYNIDEVAEITFPSSLKKIGKYAFYGNKFTNITFNEGLEVIEEHAFDNSKELTTLSLPNSIQNVGKAAFRNCLVLESVNCLSSAYTTVSADTFKYCGNLTDINLPNVTEINESAFESCTALTAYNMPNIKKIGKSAFRNCTGIVEITLDKNLETIENNAFEGCTKVEEIIFRSSKLNDLEAANAAFYNCGSESNGIKVVIEGEVTSVPKRLFLSSSNSANLPNITEIVINAQSLNLIDDYAFGYIEASVTYVGTKTMWGNVKVNLGNNCFSKVNCVKELAGE